MFDRLSIASTILILYLNKVLKIVCLKYFYVQTLII